MGKIGTAYVDVDADFSQFDRAVDRRVAEMQAKFKTVGDSAGQEFVRRFDDKLDDRTVGDRLTQGLRARFKATGDQAAGEFNAAVGGALAKNSGAFTGFEAASTGALARLRSALTGTKVDLEAVAAAQDKVSAAARAASSADLQRQQAALNVARAEQQVAAVSRQRSALELAQRQATLNVAKAQDDLTAATQKTNLTAAEREQAVINVGKAEQALEEITQRAAAADGEHQQASLNVAKAHHAVESAAAAATNAERKHQGALHDLESAMSGAGNETRKTARGFEGLVAAFGGGNGGIRSAARALDEFGGAGGGATATIGGFRIALAALIPIAISFGGAAVSVVSALAPLIGLAGAAGNAMGAAAQGFGVFKLATAGIADAIKEQTTNQLQSASTATSNASAQRAAAAAIVNAHDGVRSAVEQLARAQETAKTAEQALTAARTDARRALVDMHASLEDSIVTQQRAILGLEDAKNALAQTLAGASPQDIQRAQEAVTQAAHDQEQAVLNLDKAQANLAAVNANATATDLERRQALLDVQAAQDGLTDSQNNAVDAQKALDTLKAGPSDEQKRKALLDVRDAQDQVTEATRDQARQQKDVAAADAAGVAGSAQVVAAQKAIRDAHRAVTDAERNVVKAQQAVTEAQLAAHDSALSAADGAAKLHQKLDALPAPAQAFVRTLMTLKPRLDELRATAAGGFFPGATAGLNAAMGSFGAVKRVVAETAAVLGDFTRKLGVMVGSAPFARDIETIGGRNAHVMETMGEAFRHIVSAIRNVLVAAGPLTQWLADTVDKWSLQAAAAAKAGRENGKLADFFDRTRAVAERLGSILGHLASGLFGIGKAGTDSGNDILRSIDRASARFDRWANSVKGQTALHDFFTRAKELAAAFIPVLSGVTGAIGALALKTLPLTTALRLLGPYAGDATTAFIAYKIASFAVAQAVKIATAAQWLLNAALTANPIGLVVVGLAALAAAFIVAYEKCDTFRAIVDTAFGWIKDHWPLLLGILTGPIGIATVEIITHFQSIVDFVRTLPGKFVDAIKSAPHLLVNAGSWVVNRVVDGFMVVTEMLGMVGGWFKNRVVEFIHAEITGLKAVGGWTLNRIADGFMVVTEMLGMVGGWFKNRVVEFIHAETDGLVGAGHFAINAVANAFMNTTDAVGKIGGWFKNRVVEAFNGVKDGFVDLGGGVIGWIVLGLKKGANLLVDFLNDIVHVINKLPAVNIGDIPKFDTSTDKAKDIAYAQGGVVHHDQFARGGRITRPMVVVGEEAPQHDEYVVPTNPAYRGRALDLFGSLGKSLGVPGFAKGAIWHGRVSTFGPPTEAAGTTASGVSSALAGIALRSTETLGHLFDVAIAGHKARLKQTDWGPAAWTGRDIDVTGAGARALGFNPFSFPTDALGTATEVTSGGGGISGILHGILHGAQDVAGDVLNLLKDGAKALLGKLPGVGDLPDWLKGTGRYLLHHVTDWIKDKATGILGLGGGGGGGLGYSGPPADAKRLGDVDYVRSHTLAVTKYLDEKFGLTQSSGYRSPQHNAAIGGAPGSLHTHGSPTNPGATDSVGARSAMDAMIAFAGEHIAGLKEAMVDNYAGLGYNAHIGFFARGGVLGSDGASIMGPFVGSYRDGGIVPRDGLAHVHAGETITPANALPPQVHVYVGDREITDIVRVEIRDHDRAAGAAYRAGITR